MLRQRLRVEASTLVTVVTRILVVGLGAALAYYGAMLVLLAFKVSPDTVNDLCGYRSAFDYLAGLTAVDISSSDRLIIAIGGVVVGLVSLLLLWRGLPSTHLARHPLILANGDRGVTEIQPRAMERAVEAAALGHAGIVGARARLGDEAIDLAVTADDAADLVSTLREVVDLARESLTKHQLELERVDVTLAGYKGQNGRNLK